MGLLSWLFERKATDVSNYTWSELFPGHVKSGVTVNVWTALRTSTVLACARVLAEGVAQMPLNLFNIDPENNTKTKNITHPAYHLLSCEPNDWMTAFELREMMTMHAVLTGNAYAYLGWTGPKNNRKLIEIIPLVPHQVVVNRETDYTLTYTVTDLTGKTTTIPAENVLHLRGPSWDGYLGMDAVQLAREAIGLAIATEETHASLHANGAQPGGVLSVKGKLDKDARNRLKEQWQQFQGGVQNRFKTAVLDVDADWKSLAMSGVDSQHLETRRFQIEEICRSMRVFPQMVMHSDKTSTFASAGAFFQAHVDHSLMPWVLRWEQAINRVILGDDDNLIAKLNVNIFLRGDAAARSDFYMKALGGARGETAYMTRNEVRELEDLNPIAGGDELLIPQIAAPPASGHNVNDPTNDISKANPNHGSDGRFASGPGIRAALAAAGGAAAIAARAVLKHLIKSGAARLLARYAIIELGLPAVVAIAADIGIEAIWNHVNKSDAIEAALDKLSPEDLDRLVDAIVDRSTPDQLQKLMDAVAGSKANPNHGPDGRFASGPGIHASGTEAVKLKKQQWIAQSASKLKTVDDIYKSVDTNKALLDKAGQQTAQETQTHYVAGPIKKVERVLQKITEGRTPNAVNDIVRSTVYVNSPTEADKVVSSLAKQLPVVDEGFGAKNTGYFDRALNVRFPNGQLGEVLVMSPEIGHAKDNGGHDLYTGERSLPKGHPLKEVLVGASRAHYQRAHDVLGPQWSPTLATLGLKRSIG